MEFYLYERIDAIGSGNPIHLSEATAGANNTTVKFTEEQVFGIMRGYGLDTYRIEVNCEAIVMWVECRIVALALNDQEECDASDAEYYIREHEQYKD